MSGAPFIKVEATKFTEVGYVGRDVESMVRDLMEIGINLVREEENARVRKAAEAAAESRLTDLLLPSSFGQEERNSTREKLLQQFRLGFLDQREVEMEVTEQGGQGIDIFAIPGMEQMGGQVKDMFSKAFPPRRSRRKMKIRDAFNVLVQEESGKLVDQEALTERAKDRVEQSGIIFIDEIDKIASSSQNRTSDISREGVQRDLLPIVEGSSVNTKYGMVRTDHILFIAAGAFHFSKPSDMIPELQGVFPAGGIAGLGKGGIPAHSHRAGQCPDQAVRRPAGHGTDSPELYQRWSGGSGGFCRGYHPARKTSVRDACIPSWKNSGRYF